MKKKPSYKLLILLILLIPCFQIFAQCPSGSSYLANDKCMYVSWDNIPSPLPTTLVENSETFIYESGVGTADDPAIYLNENASNCNGGSIRSFSGMMEMGDYICTYVNGGLTSQVLPVEFTKIEARLTTDNTVEIYWETASEINNLGFEIQVKRPESQDWQTIGWQEGRGIATGIKRYSFIDEKPVIGENQYRLTQVDVDDNFTYSRIVSVNYKLKGNHAVLAPNPAQDSFSIINIEEGRLRSVQILDTLGKAVLHTKVTNGRIDVSDLTKGMYFVLIEYTSGQRIIEKMYLDN